MPFETELTRKLGIRGKFALDVAVLGFWAAKS